jgi:hypothetical protein
MGKNDYKEGYQDGKALKIFKNVGKAVVFVPVAVVAVITWALSGNKSNNNNSSDFY